MCAHVLVGDVVRIPIEPLPRQQICRAVCQLFGAQEVDCHAIGRHLVQVARLRLQELAANLAMSPFLPCPVEQPVPPDAVRPVSYDCLVIRVGGIAEGIDKPREAPIAMGSGES